MGWIASILTLIGLLLNARKVRASWLVWMVGNGLWMMHGLQTNDNAIITLNVVMALVNYYGFFSWRPDAPAKLQTEDFAGYTPALKGADLLYTLKARRDAERRKDAAREAVDLYFRCPFCGRKDCFHCQCLD